VDVLEAELVLGGPSHPDGRVEAFEVDPAMARDGADVGEGGAALAAPDRLRWSGGPPAGQPPDQSSHAAGCVRVRHVSGSPHPMHETCGCAGPCEISLRRDDRTVISDRG
jgi:hypothetical protein